MKTKTLGLALVCLSLIGTPALAIDIGLGASAGGDASVSSSGNNGVALGLGGSVDLATNAGTSQDDDLATANATATAMASLASSKELSAVIALIESSNWSSTTLSSAANIDATAYDVGAWITSDNEAAFDAALSAHATEIADLQIAVAANAAFDAWLEASNAEATDVIAVGVAADGSLAVFTN